MKYLLLCSTVFCCSLSAQAQTGWLRRFPALYNLYSVQPLPDGYALIATTLDQVQVYQVRVDLAGVTQDSITLGSIPDDIVPASDGGFFKGFLASDTLRLQKLSGNGNVLWEELFIDSLPQKDLRLAAAPDGSCYALSVRKQLTGTGWTTVVRRIAGDGSTLWSFNTDNYAPWNYNTDRSLADAVVLPDSSCLALTQDRWNPWQVAAHLYQTKPDGSAGYSVGIPLPTFGDGLSSQLSLARPVNALDVLAFGDKVTGSSGGHPSSTQWGFVNLITRTNFFNTQETLYPPSHSVMGMTTYGSRPIVGAPMPDGDMIVVEKKDNVVRLYRGSTDLKDTTWFRPLTSAGGFQEDRVKRPNRLLYPTPDHGAILGGVDNAGVFLMKIGLWGNDTLSSFFSFSGQVVEDQDLDCQTLGPYTPMANAHIRLSSADYPGLRWKARTDSLGQIAAYLPPGVWQAEATDTVAIYGKNCLQTALFAVADSFPAPAFTLPVLRYRARLSGQIWNDQNGNCLRDEGDSGLGGQAIMLTKDGKTYTIYANNQGYFSVAADTGRYEAQISYRDANVLSGFYCQPTSAYLPDYQASDSIILIYSRLKDCKVQVALQRDVNFDCQPDPNQAFDGLGIQLTDTVTGTQACYYPSFGTTTYTVNVYGYGTLKVDFCPDFPDSLKCTPEPRYFNFQFDQDHQIYADTLRAHHPRFLDSLSVCPGQWAYGAVGPNDTIVTSTGYFLGNIPILKYHHVSFLPAPVTHLYVVDTMLAADSLQTFHYTAADGCDSTVYIHWMTTTVREHPLLPPLRLSPNPASTAATLLLPTPDFHTVTIMDFSGKIIVEQSVESTQTVPLSFRDILPGMYLVQAIRSDGQIAFGKIVISQ